MRHGELYFDCWNAGPLLIISSPGTTHGQKGERVGGGVEGVGGGVEGAGEEAVDIQ